MIKLSIFILLVIFNITIASEPIYVSKFISHGESTPKFTEDQIFNTTKLNYGGLESDKLTPIGVKHIWQFGFSSRIKYKNNRMLLSNSYTHKNLYIRGMMDNPSILSAYAFVIGIFPQTVEGIRFMNDFKDSVEEVTLDELNSVRVSLNIPNQACGDQMLNYYGGNRDLEFLEHPLEMYPSLNDNITYNLNEAKILFERKYGDRMYKDMSETIGVDLHLITYSSAILYLDDYVTAKYNGFDVPYEYYQETKNIIQMYYKSYYKNGLFKDPNINKVFTNSYFKSLAKEIILKYENDQDINFGSSDNEYIDTVGLSAHFGNHQTFLAIMHQLGEMDDYFPSYSEQITWELLKSGGQFKVKAEYDGKPMKLEGHANPDGEMSLDDFVNYI